MSIQTSSVATLKQGKHLLDLFDQASVDEVQNLIGNGDLLKLMLRANLSKVDRKAFINLLFPPVQIPSGLLTPVDRLVERFMTRSELRKWGFTDKDASTLATRLEGHDHVSPLLPISIGAWLGRDIRYNWNEALAWVLDTAHGLGLKPQNYIGSAALDFYPGSEIHGRRKLSVIGLDFQTFRDSRNGAVPSTFLLQRERWPSLEVPFFLGLNPNYMQAMDGGDTPFLMSLGLVIESDGVPRFSRKERKFYADYDWAVGRWRLSAIVAFRELRS